MKRIGLLLLVVLVMSFPERSEGQNEKAEGTPMHPELKAYPAAKDGQRRFVVVLPDKDRGEEGDFLVELIPGKVMETDGVNRYQLGSKIETKVIDGWGYSYYRVTGPDVAMSTRMAAPPGTPTVKRFVAGESLKIRYNSRLPVVIYAPDGYVIKYRIWTAPSDAQTAEQG